MSDGSTGPRLGRGPGPNDCLPTPDVLSRGTWLPPLTLLLRCWPVGVQSSPLVVLVPTDETDPGPRLRVLTVTLLPPAVDPRGEARGGVGFGAGNFERADWTRASRRCIWAVRDRI